MRFLRYMAPWTILVVIFAFQWHATDAIRGFTWDASDYIRWSMVEWYTLALLAPAVFKFAARYPIEPPRRLLYLPLHIVASIAFTACAVSVPASRTYRPPSTQFRLSRAMPPHTPPRPAGHNFFRGDRCALTSADQTCGKRASL